MFVWHDFNALDIDIMVVVVITAFRGGDALDGDGELVCTCVSRFLSSGC